jgi:hypothetical protein
MVNGVSGYRYGIRNSVLDNGTTDPNTWCNCAGDCLPQGIINTTTCLMSGPVYMSYPHFHDADPYYRRQVNGMNPDPSTRDVELIVEPVSANRRTLHYSKLSFVTLRNAGQEQCKLSMQSHWVFNISLLFSEEPG